MQTIRRQHPFTPWSSRAFRLYFQNRKILTYDIETSGLSPAASQIILTGFLRVRPGEGGLYTAETVQYFAEKPGEEEAVVAASLAELREAEVVLTYNGRSFDLPFTENRARKLGLADGQKTGGLLPGLFDLDLFTIIRNWSDLGSFLPSLSQKSIEAYLGRSESREDEITGYDSVKLYENYLLIGSFNLREKILLHNHDDILQLAGLLPVLKNCDLHRALFHQGFPAGPFLVRKISPSMNGLSVTAEARGPVQEYISFPSQDRPFRLVSSASRGEVELTFPTDAAAPGLPVLDLEALYGGLGLTPDPEAQALMDTLPGTGGGYLALLLDGEPNVLGINLFLLTFLPGLAWLLEEDV